MDLLCPFQLSDQAIITSLYPLLQPSTTALLEGSTFEISAATSPKIWVDASLNKIRSTQGENLDTLRRVVELTIGVGQQQHPDRLQTPPR